MARESGDATRGPRSKDERHERCGEDGTNGGAGSGDDTPGAGMAAVRRAVKIHLPESGGRGGGVAANRIPVIRRIVGGNRVDLVVGTVHERNELRVAKVIDSPVNHA